MIKTYSEWVDIVNNLAYDEVLVDMLSDWRADGSRLTARIAELEAEKSILEDQQREAKNILIDKKLQIDSLYEEGYKLQQRIAELEADRRWIPVSERLPEDRATILAAFKNQEILTATYYKHYEGFGGVENYWHIEGWHSGEVTHWMPLPTPPEVTG